MRQKEWDTILAAANALEDDAIAAYFELISDVPAVDCSSWSYGQKCAYGDPVKYKLATNLRELLKGE